jgi:hypothetical protein
VFETWDSADAELSILYFAGRPGLAFETWDSTNPEALNC